ncbi:MAG: hypothetical protein ACI93T_002923, partial [Porticoccaceae bacterium]
VSRARSLLRILNQEKDSHTNLTIEELTLQILSSSSGNRLPLVAQHPRINIESRVDDETLIKQ